MLPSWNRGCASPRCCYSVGLWTFAGRFWDIRWVTTGPSHIAVAHSSSVSRKLAGPFETGALSSPYVR